MPHLARVLDGIPRERRAVVDLWGRFNDTIRLDHDFNHLEKLDGHLGWEWEEALRRSPTRSCSRPRSAALRRPLVPVPWLRPRLGRAAAHDARARPRRHGRDKPYGVMYVGSNWQRWDQVRRFLELRAVRERSRAAHASSAGTGAQRPDWAVQKGIMGIDTDPALLAELGVEVRDGVRFDEVVGLLGQARFAPVFHRPLFRHLGFVTNRTFETFYADTLPVLMLPRDFVPAVYGPAALTLVPGDDVAAHLDRRPAPAASSTGTRCCRPGPILPGTIRMRSASGARQRSPRPRAARSAR